MELYPLDLKLTAGFQFKDRNSYLSALDKFEAEVIIFTDEINATTTNRSGKVIDGILKPEKFEINFPFDNYPTELYDQLLSIAAMAKRSWFNGYSVTKRQIIVCADNILYERWGNPTMLALVKRFRPNSNRLLDIFLLDKNAFTEKYPDYDYQNFLEFALQQLRIKLVATAAEKLNSPLC